MTTPGMKPPSDRAARFFLGGIIVVGFYAAVGAVLLLPLKGTERDLALVLLGAMIASYKDVTGYFFGASSSEAAKDQTIATQATTAAAAVTAATGTGNGLTSSAAPTGTVADPVAVTQVAPAADADLEIFRAMVRRVNPGVTDAEIEEAWAALKAGRPDIPT